MIGGILLNRLVGVAPPYKRRGVQKGKDVEDERSTEDLLLARQTLIRSMVDLIERWHDLSRQDRHLYYLMRAELREIQRIVSMRDDNPLLM